MEDDADRLPVAMFQEHIFEGMMPITLLKIKKNSGAVMGQ